GISVSTLSVETSTSGSSASTVSPTCLRHSRTVPSVTDSPMAGIVIWTVVPVDMYYKDNSPREQAATGLGMGLSGPSAGPGAGGLAGPPGARPRAARRPRVRRRPQPGRRAGTRARGPAARARPDAAPLPAVVRVLVAGRLDRHPRRRPLRHALHAQRRPGRV